MVALIDDPTRADEILAAAARFDVSDTEDFSILVTREAMAVQDELRIQLAELIGSERQIRVEALRADEPAFVAHSVRQLGGGLLVAGFGGGMITSEIAVTRIATALECPLLLLRCGEKRPAAA